MEIKKCPFCGVRAYAHKIAGTNFYDAHCGNEDCGVQPRTVRCESREKAIKMWNRRVDDDQKRA